ncbi:hypothetical protein OHA74_55140 [Streptomyces phaeochromogenes]|uniref:hypothetical protein n=1 Tax=Streptomyces phaeochromogenes TaxID=1923 RepID=UPI002E2B916D|nr:hypothetical protein [Streptomyces phaeochromogenes]
MKYFLFAFFALGSPFMAWKAVQLWRNPDLVDFFMASFTWMPFGKEVKRGEVRSIGLTAASLWGITLLVWLALFDPDASTSSYILVAAPMAILVPAICEVCVVLFNAWSTPAR